MAVKMCVSVIFLYLLTLECVFAKDCPELEGIFNCKECITCGGQWCNSPIPTKSRKSIHCRSPATPFTNWCTDDIVAKNTPINIKNPDNATKSKLFQEITVGTPHRIPITNIPSDKVHITIDKALNLTSEYVCDKETCYIESVAGVEFCSQGYSEISKIKIKAEDVNIDVTYHVSCTCGCSKTVDEKSAFCNRNGNYSCGVCSCNDKWVGEYCEDVCPNDEIRGDQIDRYCWNIAKPNTTCSGNGICGPCKTCECYTDREGSQYFDKDENCLDLCSNINYYCEDCLINGEPGLCTKECNYPMTLQPCNATIAAEKNDYNMSVWINCTGTEPSNYVEYKAMRSGNEIYVMYGSCDGTAEGAFYTPTNVKVPVVLGVLLAVAAVMAVAGYMVWRSRTPGPDNMAQLNNFDGQNSTGSNPFYRPPTSSFTNPTYNKL